MILYFTIWSNILSIHVKTVGSVWLLSFMSKSLSRNTLGTTCNPYYNTIIDLISIYSAVLFLSYLVYFIYGFLISEFLGNNFSTFMR